MVKIDEFYEVVPEDLKNQIEHRIGTVSEDLQESIVPSTPGQ